MRTVYSIFLIVGFGLHASAQQVHFIYLQTDNNTAFYAKMSDKIYNSSSSGYVTLSNLVDSTYNFSIGFPSTHSEAKFEVVVSGSDRGLLIKNDETGISLADLQTGAVINAQVNKAQKNISYQAKNDEFTTLLAKASNDSSLLFVPVITKPDVAQKEQKTEEVKSNTDEDIVKADTTAVKPQANVAIEIKNPDTTTVALQSEQKTITVDSSLVTKQPGTQNRVTDTAMTVQPVEEYKRSVVQKHSESSTSEGFGLVYYDTYSGGADTIRLIIPNPRFAFRQTDTVRAEDQIQMIDSRKDTVLQKIDQVNATQKKIPNSSCTSIATNKDFFKLRKNMAARQSDETMVDEAKKYFRNRCFTTEQIKNLSTLFLTSAGKYQFFDAAYLHVTDQDQFAALQSEIKDEYYIKRFKALVGD